MRTLPIPSHVLAPGHVPCCRGGAPAPGRRHRARRRTVRGLLAALLLVPVTVVAATLGEGLALYREGRYEAAFRILEDLALDGDPQALTAAGEMLQDGLGTPVDLAEAVRFFRFAAGLGHVRAQIALALALQEGRGVERDESAAVQWLATAADQGDADARFHLAQAYRAGRGVEQDLPTAMRLLRAGADAGHAPSQAALAALYAAGQRGAADAPPVASYREAAREGDVNAQVQLGFLYDTGTQVELDPEAARDLYQQAALHGNADAQARLAQMLRSGRGGVQDRGLALYWDRQAADRGEPAAQNNVGMAYLLGEGVERDDELALEWFLKAARQENAHAQNNIGHMRLEGRAGPVDDGEALEWFRAAAAQGLAAAQANIGYAYLKGRGVPKDPQAARQWFQKAADQGYPPALGNLGYLYQEGIGAPRDRERARSLYEEAAQGGYAYAMRNLGYMHEYGVGVAKQLPAALDWYQAGAARGDRPSQEGVERLCARYLLAGCGGEMVVLLREDDGKIGKVVVESGGQELLLDSHMAASRVSGPGAVASVEADDEKLAQVFAGAIAAFPPRVLTYTVHFAPGAADLDARASRQVAEALGEMLPELARREAVEVLVVGHTDSVGEADDNDVLSRARAATVRDALLAGGIATDAVQASGRGERDPKVTTPDGRAEYRNRRVEITLR